MWEVVRIANGRESVEGRGSRQKMNDLLRQLRASTRRGVSGWGRRKYYPRYELREAKEETDG
jgi:hypothetical protein